MMTATAAVTMDGDASTGGRLVSADGRVLPLLGARLAATARGGIARAVLEQRFHNPYPDPLRVTYLFPLPHDGAVSGFAFRIGDRRVVGEVDRRAAARERFEEAIASGRTAALVDQERGSLFTQELGNVPPGAEIVAELIVDQRLAWLPTGAWEWRFPTAVAPRYQGAAGRVADAGRIQVDVADAPLAPRLTLAVRIEDALALEGGRAPESPSHAVAFRPEAGALAATFAAEGGVGLDRDVVLRWPVAAPEVGVTLETFRAAAGPLAASAFGLVTLVPPAPGAAAERFPRDLVVLIDTSGSMSGEPLAQARRVVSALVDGLGDEDTLELVEFSNASRRWRRGATRATARARKDALSWLAKLRASGSTEMRDAIVEALAGLRADAQRQVLLVTDGLIGFEQEIVREVLERLPAGSRLHTLGVGSSVNRSLLGPAARAGRGTESIVGVGEDAERAVRTVVGRMVAPLVTSLEVSGDALAEHVPARLPDLFGGAPALLSVRLRPEGGALRVRGRVPGGTFERTLAVAPVEAGAGRAALAALFGREAVEDQETRLAAGDDAEAVDRAVERLGLDHRISTRLTSWIAVSEEASVDPARPTRRVAVPHELPHGMSVEGLGLRAAAVPLAMPCAAPPASLAAVPALTRRAGTELLKATASLDHGAPLEEAAPSAAPEEAASHAPGTPVQREAPSPKRGREEARAHAQAKATSGGRPGRPAPMLQGRIVVRRDRLLILEATVEAPLDWAPPATATLHVPGGFVSAEVDPRRTTAAGRLEAGHVLRLVLVVPEDAAVGDGDVVAVTLGSGLDAVTVTLLGPNAAPPTLGGP
jgi:Ca-activated chloride channel family protein